MMMSLPAPNNSPEVDAKSVDEKYLCPACEVVEVSYDGNLCVECDKKADALVIPPGMVRCGWCELALVDANSNDAYCDKCNKKWDDWLVQTGNNDPIPISDNKPTQMGFSNFVVKQCKVDGKHNGEKPVMIGGYPVRLGARDKITNEVLCKVDVVISLNGDTPKNMKFGQGIYFVDAGLPDYGGVPDNWVEFLNWVIKQLQEGMDIVAYCTGSHGRTGVFGATLISLLEPETEDPIQAIRDRHCNHAVESRAQAIAVFAARGQELPEKYEEEFPPKITTVTSTGPHQPTIKHSVSKEDVESRLPFGEWWTKRKEYFLNHWKDFRHVKDLSPEARELVLMRAYKGWYEGMPTASITPVPKCAVCDQWAGQKVNVMKPEGDKPEVYLCDWCYGDK